MGGGPQEESAGLVTGEAAAKERYTSRFVLTMCVANLVGALAHGIGIGLTLAEARTDIKMGFVKWVPVDIGNATHPMFERQVKTVWHIYPTQIVVAWFALSFTFHLVIGGLLAARGVRSSAAGWYLRGLYKCRAWWRWGEYFFSASIMMLVAVRMLGQRELYAAWAVVGCMATTQLFGWATELYSSSHIVTLSKDDPGVRTLCGYTLLRRWDPDPWVTVHRFSIHLGGYIPYFVSWYIVVDAYNTNMDAFGDYLPDFIPYMVWASLAVFTLFGLVQLWNQIYSFGPSLYWLGELIYVVLSFVAKAELGLLVLYQVLVPGSIYDDFLGIRNSTALADEA